MWLIGWLIASLTLWQRVSAQTASQSYWLLSKDDGQTWCGYEKQAAFKSIADTLEPIQSVRVSYSSDTLSDLTYKVNAESGDWIVIDKYTPAGTEIRLLRATLFVQAELQVIEDATIRHGKVGPFRIDSVTTFAGKRAEVPNGIDFPNVPIWTDLAATPFMTVVAEMRGRSLVTLCRSVKQPRTGPPAPPRRRVTSTPMTLPPYRRGPA